MKTKEKEIVQPQEGPTWKNSARFDTWQKADDKRHTLLKEWKEKNQKNMQVKVKRRAGGFVVKTRVGPSASKNRSMPKKREKYKKVKRTSK